MLLPSVANNRNSKNADKKKQADGVKDQWHNHQPFNVRGDDDCQAIPPHQRKYEQDQRIIHQDVELDYFFDALGQYVAEYQVDYDGWDREAQRYDFNSRLIMDINVDSTCSAKEKDRGRSEPEEDPHQACFLLKLFFVVFLEVVVLWAPFQRMTQG